MTAFGVHAPADDAEHGALLAGGRRQIPHQQPPALRRAPGLRAAERPGGRGRRWSPRTASRSARDPRGGPWASVIKHDRAFADAYAKQNVDAYKLIVAGMARTLFDRDTAPGAEPEDLMRLDIPALIVPGHDAAHATSAARYLEECLPRAEYWDVPVAEQTEATAPARVLEFLEKADAASS